MATALDIIKGALRRINSYQSSDQFASQDLNDSLETLNDLLDSWSTDKLQIFGTNENIVNFTGGKSIYTIGNPTNTFIGEPPFLGVVTGGSSTVSAVTAFPADLIVGATLSDQAAVIPSGTTVVSILGTSLVMSANATATPAIGNDAITYTIPGDFPFPRPLRITSGYTRFSNLDFTLEIAETQERFNEILFKAQPGPWPVVAWYNPLMPYGQIRFYQTPGSNAECHLFTDTILGDLTLEQTILMPQGYVRALKWCLAKELCGEFGFPLTDTIKVHAAESLNLIKALNAQPAQICRYDRELVQGNRPDGGWIFHGGFY
jgi:hypothetical protein